MVLDQEAREERLGLGEDAAVLLERVGARAAGAKLLALGDDPQDLRRKRLESVQAWIHGAQGSNNIDRRT